ncbi:MAG: hypothetical protein R3E78_05005 [Burkholderiaceae bacterium]
MQTGVVDGVIGSGAEGYYASFRDVTKHYIAANTHFEIWYLIAGRDRSPGELAAADPATGRGGIRGAPPGGAEADQALNEKKLGGGGARIVRPSPAELAAHAAKVRRVKSGPRS